MKAICYYYKEEPKTYINILNLTDNEDVVKAIQSDLKVICLEAVSEGYSIFDWMGGYGETKIPTNLGYSYIDPSAVERIQQIDLFDILDPELDESSEVSGSQSQLIYQVCRIFGADEFGNLTSSPPEFDVEIPKEIIDIFEEEEIHEWVKIKKVETEDDLKDTTCEGSEEFKWSQKRNDTLYVTLSETGNDAEDIIGDKVILNKGRIIYSYPKSCGSSSGSRSSDDQYVVFDGKDLWWRTSYNRYVQEEYKPDLRGNYWRCIPLSVNTSNGIHWASTIKEFEELKPELFPNQIHKDRGKGYPEYTYFETINETSNDTRIQDNPIGYIDTVYHREDNKLIKKEVNLYHYNGYYVKKEDLEFAQEDIIFEL